MKTEFDLATVVALGTVALALLLALTSRSADAQHPIPTDRRVEAHLSWHHGSGGDDDYQSYESIDWNVAEGETAAVIVDQPGFEVSHGEVVAQLEAVAHNDGSGEITLRALALARDTTPDPHRIQFSAQALGDFEYGDLGRQNVRWITDISCRLLLAPSTGASIGDFDWLLHVGPYTFWSIGMCNRVASFLPMPFEVDDIRWGATVRGDLRKRQRTLFDPTLYAQIAVTITPNRPIVVVPEPRRLLMFLGAMSVLATVRRIHSE